MFENNGKWYGYREGASKKAFSTKEEAEDFKKQLEEAGASVELK